MARAEDCILVRLIREGRDGTEHIIDTFKAAEHPEYPHREGNEGTRQLMKSDSYRLAHYIRALRGMKWRLEDEEGWIWGTTERPLGSQPSVTPAWRILRVRHRDDEQDRGVV